MFWFLASKYKLLGEFTVFVIIPHHQIFSILWFIWNITPQWRRLTISLHELASKFAHTCACFFLFFSFFFFFFFNFHIASMYMTYLNGYHFLFAFPQNYKLVSWRYWSKFISAYVRVTKNDTKRRSIFEHDRDPTRPNNK